MSSLVSFMILIWQSRGIKLFLKRYIFLSFRLKRKKMKGKRR